LKVLDTTTPTWWAVPPISMRWTNLSKMLLPTGLGRIHDEPLPNLSYIVELLTLAFGGDLEKSTCKTTFVRKFLKISSG